MVNKDVYIVIIIHDHHQNHDHHHHHKCTFAGTLKPQSSRPLYRRNTVIGTLVVDGWDVTFGTVTRGLGGLQTCSSHIDDRESKHSHAQRYFYACCNPLYFHAWEPAPNLLACKP